MMSQKYKYLSLFPEEELNENISSENKEYDLTNIFERLAKSDFRIRFHLSKKDREYVMEKGLPTIRKHAEDFVAKKTCSGCHTERRQVDSYAWTSCFLGSTDAKPRAISSSLEYCRGAKEEDEVNMPLAVVAEAASSSCLCLRCTARTSPSRLEV